MTKLKIAGIESIGFAWAGSIERGQKHYYRAAGADVPDRGSTTRRTTATTCTRSGAISGGDFGRDLLREHLRTSLH